mgnify:CR=1 FL=1
MSKTSLRLMLKRNRQYSYFFFPKPVGRTALNPNVQHNRGVGSTATARTGSSTGSVQVQIVVCNSSPDNQFKHATVLGGGKHFRIHLCWMCWALLPTTLLPMLHEAADLPLLDLEPSYLLFPLTVISTFKTIQAAFVALIYS